MSDCRHCGMPIHGVTIDGYCSTDCSVNAAWERQKAKVLSAPAQTYPDSPGFKEPTTSKETAAKIAHKVPAITAKVLAEFEAGFIGTSDQVGRRLGLEPLQIRPRVTELRTKGLIEPDHRTKENGMPKWAWRAVKKQRELF